MGVRATLPAPQRRENRRNFTNREIRKETESVIKVRQGEMRTRSNRERYVAFKNQGKKIFKEISGHRVLKERRNGF